MNTIYLAWDDGDYYGPDPVGDFVYDSLEAAKLGIDKHLQRFPHGMSVWTEGANKWEPGEWRRGNCFIEMRTPTTLAEVEAISDKDPPPAERVPVVTENNIALRDIYTPAVLDAASSLFKWFGPSI